MKYFEYAPFVFIQFFLNISLENRSYAIMHPTTGYCQGMSDSKSILFHFGNLKKKMKIFSCSGQSNSLRDG
jgi:hypothetical protein